MYSDILPTNALMVGVPGRADYVHHIADILSKDNEGIIPSGQHVIGMDIGRAVTHFCIDCFAVSTVLSSYIGIP